MSKNLLLNNKKEKISKDIVEKLFEEIKILKINNENLEKRIEHIEKENNLKNKINENIILKYKEKINDLEERIKLLENFHFINNKQVINSNLRNIKTINIHKEQINYITSLPSGNIISTSNDKSIKIYDIYLNILQIINNAHEKEITYIDIKDENNFISCSFDKNIKIWIKINNKFKLNQTINNTHNALIYKVIYLSDNNFISCSSNRTIKIWTYINNNNYENITTIIHDDEVKSLLLLKDKNILVSSGWDGTYFWNIYNFEFIFYEEAFCCKVNALKRIDNDRIIVGGGNNGIIKIISISKMKIIFNIENKFECWGICVIDNKKLFLIGGRSSKIKIYRNDNYECIQIIENAHGLINNHNYGYGSYIYGFLETKDGSIISYSNANTIKVWIF